MLNLSNHDILSLPTIGHATPRTESNALIHRKANTLDLSKDDILSQPKIGDAPNQERHEGKAPVNRRTGQQERIVPLEQVNLGTNGAAEKYQLCICSEGRLTQAAREAACIVARGKAQFKWAEPPVHSPSHRPGRNCSGQHCHYQKDRQQSVAHVNMYDTLLVQTRILSRLGTLFDKTVPLKQSVLEDGPSM